MEKGWLFPNRLGNAIEMLNKHPAECSLQQVVN